MSGEEPPATMEPPKDILEDSKADASNVLAFYQGMDKSSLGSDPLLSMFKPTEVDATMSHCVSGGYHTYWTMDKISDLQNAVDSTPHCPDSLKQVFAPGNSRNARIRANRIGKLIFDRVHELKDNGGPSGGSTGRPPAAAPQQQNNAVSKPPPSPRPSSTMSSGGSQPSQRLLAGQHLTQYVFSPDLPPEAQLRVRDSPSMEGAVVGTVTQSDEIMACPSIVAGDYLRVQISGWPEEAWMLTKMGGQSLLVPVGSASQAPSAPPPQVQTQSYQQQPPPPSMPPSTPPHHAMSQPARPPTAGVDASNPMMASQMLNISMMQPNEQLSATLTGMEGQPVPYEMYRRLEMRVNRLEQDLNTLKMCLRSI